MGQLGDGKGWDSQIDEDATPHLYVSQVAWVIPGLGDATASFEPTGRMTNYKVKAVDIVSSSGGPRSKLELF